MDPFTIASLALAGANIIQGTVRGAQAKKLGKKYDQFEAGIPMQDPGEVQRLADVRRRRAAFDAGNDPLTGYVSQQARNFGSQTQANLVRAGAQPNDLLRSNAGTANAIAGAGARAAQRGDAAFAMEGDLISSMATRAYNRQLSRAQRIWTEYQAKKQGSNQAIQAGLGMLPNIAFQAGQKRVGPTPGIMTDQINASLPSNRAMEYGGDQYGEPTDSEIAPTYSPMSFIERPPYA